MSARPSHRVAPWALALCILLLVVPLSAGLGPADAASSSTADAGAVTVEETEAAIRVEARGYTAVVDKPHGNLVGLWNARGHRLFGTDPGTGGIQGLVAHWAGGAQQDGDNPDEPTLTVDADAAHPVVTVDHVLFTETYRFHPDRVEVRFEAAGDTTAAHALHLVGGSVLEPSREATRRFDVGAYGRLGGYPTDFATDRSSGQFSLWTTATSTVYAHTYRVAMAEPVLEGWCRWYTTQGTARFDALPGADRPSGLPFLAACNVTNQTDAEAAGVVARRATHQVVQDVGPFAAGDAVTFEVAVDARGYDAREVEVPISTRPLDGDGEAPDAPTTKAKVLVPWHKPEGGYRLAIFHPGHWDEMYTHSYLWDVLANHGFIVATPHTTADMGDDHARHDWGYMEQVEFTDLRHWVQRSYDVDPDRVVGVGISLGGLNVLLDAVNHPDAFAATAFYSGAYDFERFWTGSAFGLASVAGGIEVADCCGRLPADEESRFAWDLRNPKLRIDQFEGDLVIVHGAGDVVAPTDHSLDLHHDVPGSTLHVAAGAHENNVFAGHRKEVLHTLLEAERSDAQRDRVDVRLYGRPDLVPEGYAPLDEPHSYTTDWLKVWVEDAAWTRVRAERTPTGVAVEADRPVRVAVRLPEECAPACEVLVDGERVPLEQVAFPDDADALAGVFEVAPGGADGAAAGGASEAVFRTVYDDAVQRTGSGTLLGATGPAAAVLPALALLVAALVLLGGRSGRRGPPPR